MKFTVNSIYKAFFTLLLTGGLLLSGEAAMAAGYHEYENPPCYDVSGKTTEVLVPGVGGVNNGGIMDFDEVGVEEKYQACVRMSAAGPTGVPDHLEGWVWNDNLGWVSMYCPVGLGAKNLGLSCGAIPYSVTFATTGTAPNFASVSMSGNAWGDNIGYISFNSGFHQMKPVPNGASRGLINSAVQSDTHAWADSVGWLDFSGVKFRWEAEPFVPQDDDVKIWDLSETCDLATGCSPSVVNTPVGNADHSYTIEIPFKDDTIFLKNTQVEDCPTDSVGMYETSTSGKPYCAKIELKWLDNVDYDQTTSLSQNSNTSGIYSLTSAPAGSGAVTKPLNYKLSGGDFNYQPGLKPFWGADVKSFAPTSDRNIADGMPLEKFNYVDEGRLDLGWDRLKFNENRLSLAKVNLMLFKYSTGPDADTGLPTPGTCIMGDINDPVPPGPPSQYTCNMHTYVEDVNMPFRPLVEVTKLVHKYGTKELNYFNIDNVEESQTFLYQIAKNAGTAIDSFNARFDIGLEDDSNYFIKFAGDPSETSTSINDASTFGEFVADLTTVFPGSSFSSTAGPYLFSKISYGLSGKTIKYFSNKLPRITAGILKNPVAKVQGNVYLTDYTAKTSDFSLRSLGNISSNLRREEITRNVQKYLRGYTTDLVTANKTVNNGDVANISGFTVLVEDKVFYLKDANLTIECLGGCKFDSNVTFIVENGNIFVNSDIVPEPGVQVGLIALRNLDGNVKNQGFLYLDKDVTWLSHVHIYLDRVMQSYDKAGSSFDSNGFYKMEGNDSYRQERFKNQFVLEGTISSMNGIGNASAITPNDEEGNTVEGNVSCESYGGGGGPGKLLGICRARVVDLNYLRYYGPGLEICTGGESVTGPYPAIANIPRDQALRDDPNKGLGCNPDVPEYAINAAVMFDAAHEYGDLIGGGEADGKQSPFFVGKSGGLDNQFPVNFFYIPISPDLAGFEQMQEFNPVIQ